jgi:hypothetical protein
VADVSRRRAVVAGLAAVALALAAVTSCSDGGGDEGGAAPASGAATTTTVNSGGLDIAAPDGWTPIPVPDLGFGVAVPPGWEAVLLSPEGLATLAGSSPNVPGFVDMAHAAATQGGLVYAAGVDQAGGISDVVVRGAPAAGVTDTAGLESYARELAAGAGRPAQEITVVDGAPYPTVRMRFEIGAADAPTRAQGTETLVAGPNDVVWDVTVTSDDAATHDDLADQITGTLTLAAPAG